MGVDLNDRPGTPSQASSSGSNDGEVMKRSEGKNERGGRWGPRVAAAREPQRAGVYLPPAKRRLLEEEERKQDEKEAGQVDVDDSLETQRSTWQAQKRVVHGTMNRLNAQTIKPLIHDLLAKVNILRLKGILTKSLLQAATSAPRYAPVYAALVAVINSKLPEVGEFVVQATLRQLKRSYKRGGWSLCVALSQFCGHLFHQNVVHELLILQLLTLFLEDSDKGGVNDGVEVAVQLLTTTGYTLLEVSPLGVRAVLERFRALLHDGSLHKRVAHQVEGVLKLRQGGFRDDSCYPPIPPELDLVEEEDQITFQVSLDDEEDKDVDELVAFRRDPNYAELEQTWKEVRAELLGLNDDDSSEGSSSSGGDGESETDDDDADDNKDDTPPPAADADKSSALVVVQDLSEADLVHLRRTIYLTIMSSATFEECTHKLAQLNIPDGREEELINMLIECCSQERTFLRYYGLIAARFCLLQVPRWQMALSMAFTQQYQTIHRLETNKLRNVAKLFSHLLHTDSLAWSDVLGIIHMNEEETTSSSRIFVKILLQEMAQAMGMERLKKRFFHQPEHVTPEQQALVGTTLVMPEYLQGMFPKDNVRNTRYAINFFTSIGLGPLTDDLRDFLKQAPKLMLQAQKMAATARQQEDDGDDSSSVTSSSSSASSSSLSSSSLSSSSSSSSSSSDDSYDCHRRRRCHTRRSRSGHRSSSLSPSDEDDDRPCGGRHDDTKHKERERDDKVKGSRRDRSGSGQEKRKRHHSPSDDNRRQRKRRNSLSSIPSHGKL